MVGGRVIPILGDEKNKVTSKQLFLPRIKETS